MMYSDVVNGGEKMQEIEKKVFREQLSVNQ